MPGNHIIQLYDVQSKLNPPAWSPHVWRTRFILNYKGLPYATRWLPYPDVQTVMPAIGALPTRTEAPLYTLPTIIDEAEGKPPIIMTDSSLIADYLERAYPEPSIYPGGRDLQMTYIAAVVEHILKRMAFMVFPHTTSILEGRDREYYVGSRKGFFGVDLEDMFPPDKQESMWAALEQGCDELSTFVDSIEHSEQWLFSATEGPGYADFVLGAIFIWFKLSGPEGGWGRLKRWNNGRWERFFESLQPYIQIV